MQDPTSTPATAKPTSSTGEAPNAFAHRLAADGQTLRRSSLTTLQLNLGKMCNLACHHCHVEAGPQRGEIMSWTTMQRILDWVDVAESGIATIDLTGGAPEMNPHFRDLVAALRDRDLHVLDRCNLTILLEESHADLIAFLAAHRVEIVASLPCYMEENVDAQRGKGVFHDSIDALQRLNAVGYGVPESGLRLDLVYNPVGYGLPPDQASLEADYKAHLKTTYGVIFNRLWTITNMPIKRFAHALHRDAQYAPYMDRLIAAHNATNVEGVMCRSLISVGWQGSVYDCDFNQMLQMTVDPDGFGPTDDEHHVESRGRKLWEYGAADLLGASIRSGDHCFGCTAGAGSSCTGAIG